ncbi:3,4-dihydroxy-2-butanone 4-phosphate synthase, RibB [Corchorus olitorius]|uniref:3,4-dihydroxy-2-butanone 4-phosphate synthase, RibB n=1 Tax=Corchorus olitorius TaxID=93759 RepID=A0A1R3HS55_9ROSI|nr:3,4-dihydroxy-2-butanone 4-phosphate synthase, RibB [Corchorus olitorius]
MASINLKSPSMSLSRLQGYKYNYGNPIITANGCILTRKLGLSFKGVGIGKVRAALVSGEGDVLSYPNGNGVVAGNTGFVNGIVDHQAGIEIQPDAISFGTLSAEITPTTSGFFADEYDLDRPTDGFASIPEAIEDIRQGKLVIVVDDEDRENEGDLIMAASMATPEAMAFIVKHGTGIVCVSMKAEDLERLELPLMVSQKENEEKLCTAFTVSVDGKYGTTTGVSARDRATTVLALASKDSKPEDFNRPGHIFPLKYREGGVLKRAGHTEASVDLAVLAGLEPAAVLCEIVDDDGSMARLPKLREFAQAENLKIISIADLIRYRRKRDRLVELSSAALIPTMWGPFEAYCYRSLIDGIEHIAMVKSAICTRGVFIATVMQHVSLLCKSTGEHIYFQSSFLSSFACNGMMTSVVQLGDINDGQDILVRVHSECLTGDIFGSARCDCGNQLALAMKQIEAAGQGVLVYLRGHEGRGIGLGHKLRAYNLQDDGRDTVEANEELGLPVDSREYGLGAQILRDLGVRTMKLMTNNPAKYVGLKGYGLAISGRVPLLTPITKDNKRYLETKRAKMGHIYGSDIDSTSNSNISSDDMSET